MSGAPAYPFDSNDEVAAIKREDAAYYDRAAEFFDGDDYDRHRAFPTRPSDSDLLAPAHFHNGCRHHCISGAPACVSDPLCMSCQLAEPEGHARRQQPLRKRA